ncbi:Glycerol uptake operon antiterminator regulatory protein [Lachnospiraceae bacterium TWA4]|nr:Glycerol uptake operon antiterminator regulatory protein [Lachnospiraceae bacterium TWA4]
MPKIIKKLTKNLSIPLIAGGLISEREDVVAALNAGAIAVSSTNQAVWNM